MRIEEREENYSVQDRSAEMDRTETGSRPVPPIFRDRRSRFGPVFGPSVGFCPSLKSGVYRGLYNVFILAENILICLTFNRITHLFFISYSFKLNFTYCYSCTIFIMKFIIICNGQKNYVDSII